MNNKIYYDGEYYVKDSKNMISLLYFEEMLHSSLFSSKDKIEVTNSKFNYIINKNDFRIIIKDFLFIEFEDGYFVDKSDLESLYDLEISLSKAKLVACYYTFDSTNSEFNDLYSDYTIGNYNEMYSTQKNKALYIRSTNDNNEMFMAFYSKISNLKPNTSYTFNLNFKISSDKIIDESDPFLQLASTVLVKAGVINKNPKKIYDADKHKFTLNIDKGFANSGGIDLKAITLLNKQSSTSGHVYKDANSIINQVTSEEGEVYLVIGTDSFYKGTSEFYLDDVSVEIYENTYPKEMVNFFDKYSYNRSITNAKINTEESEDLVFAVESFKYYSYIEKKSITKYNPKYLVKTINLIDFNKKYKCDLQETIVGEKITYFTTENLSVYKITDDVCYLDQDNDLFEIVRNNFVE